jgi:hypothetical protein
MTAAPSLTLFHIESELYDLIQFRESVETDPDMSPQDQKESLEAINSQIERYLRAEIAKVDGIAALLREFEARQQIAKDEAKRILERSKMWGERHDRLESMVLDVMLQTGQKRLDGRDSTFRLQRNPASVDVRQPDLLPTQYKRVEVTMPLNVWEALKNELLIAEDADLRTLGRQLHEAKCSDPEAMRSVILEELKCKSCKGSGKVKTEKCSACDGTGATGNIPGVRLVTEKMRLIVG